MWIARDKDGLLCIYSHKPSKGEEVWRENLKEERHDGIWTIPEDYFPEVQWEDEEPRELVLKPIRDE